VKLLQLLWRRCKALWVYRGFYLRNKNEKGKPSERMGRKADGLSPVFGDRVARLPWNIVPPTVYISHG